jgi:transposase InsO family protein
MGKILKRQIGNKIREVYSSPNSSASFRGVQAVYRALREKQVKVSMKQVEDWLLKQDSFTLHRPVRYRFKRRVIEVRGIGCIYEIDLMDLPSLTKYNDEYRYLLNVIDCFSKFAYVRKLKTKTAVEVTAAMTDVLTLAPKPLFVRSDSGKEFLNQLFQQLLKSRNINFYTSLNETKCAMIERFNLTLGRSITRYLTHNDTQRYIDVLPKLVHSYNNTYHSTIKMKPADVNKRNERSVFMNIYGSKNKRRGKEPKPCRFQLGDTVRISKSKELFRKNYKKSWTVEVFKVVKIYNTTPCVYELADESGENLIGTFYANEISRVAERQLVRIEKILKEKKHRGKNMIYVKWVNHDASHNCWILRDALHSI